MSNVITLAGATLGVVAEVPETFDNDDITGFPSLAYTRVGEVADYGNGGVSFELVTWMAVDRRDTVKRKGTRNYNARAFVIGRDASDAGQQVLEAGANGADTDTTHSFEITLQNGDIIYFTGQIMEFTDNLGTVNNIVQIGCNVELEFQMYVPFEDD